MVKMLVDPPELKQFQKRGDPPMEKWPGRWITRYDIMASCGDERDWFRYGHKLAAYKQVCLEFMDARRRRRSIRKDFSWNQILIMGDYGVGKTTLGAKVALEMFRLGHPVFSNASILFGWHLDGEELYTALASMPKNSVFLVDEGSAALSGRMGHGVAVSTFVEMNLNSRKKNVMLIYMTAQDWELAASVRRGCKEVWRPLTKERLVVLNEGDDDWSSGPLKPADDPDNFRMAWDVWDDFPYRKSDIIDGKGKDDEGFGEPTVTWYDDGENVRMAYLLNDSFALAEAGGATVADRDVVKDALRALWDRRDPVMTQDAATLTYLMDLQQSGAAGEYISPAELAGHLGTTASAASQALGKLSSLTPVRGKGFRTAEVFDFLDRAIHQLGDRDR